jgi:hypothetical protein
MKMNAGQLVSCKCHNDSCQVEFQVILVACIEAETASHYCVCVLFVDSDHARLPSLRLNE